MQITLNVPESFKQLSANQRKMVIRELEEQLKIRSEMIEGFKKPVKDFEEWEQLGFESEEWS